jgi:glycosyltransferase involved in cell wall biosynthesis
MADLIELQEELNTSTVRFAFEQQITKSVNFTQLTILNQFYPPDYAATGQLIAELAHQLQSEFSSIEVFSSQPAYAFKRDDLPRWEYLQNISIRRSKSATAGYGRIRSKTLSGIIFFLRACLHLFRHPSRRQLVLLTTAPPFLPILGYFISCFCKISYVCLLYDIYPDIAINLQVIKQQHWLTKIWDHLNCLAWNKASAIIVLNNTMKDQILAKCPEVASKISIIPNWSDPQEICPIDRDKNWFAWKHNLVDQFTVMYSGNMGRCHDVETLLDAMIILQNTPIQFVFVGSGDKRKFMQSEIKALGLTNCLFLPYQDKEDLVFSLTACDVSILSIDSKMEGLIAPSKLYSYLAAGSPIAAICPDHSYLHQVFADAQCGQAFCNGDAPGLAKYLHELSQNPELVKAMGQSGRAYCIENYTIEKVTDDYLSVFKAVQNDSKQGQFIRQSSL